MIAVLLGSRSVEPLILPFHKWVKFILNFYQRTKHYVRVPFSLILHVREAGINQQNMNFTH